jgi:hypothetical protein
MDRYFWCDFFAGGGVLKAQMFSINPCTQYDFRENIHNDRYSYSGKKVKANGKAIPSQAWTGPEGSRRLRLPDFKTVGT